MRIIAGINKGKMVKSSKELNIRPTSDKVKEALFNILRNTIEDSIFVDLFAGTGNIGIEALSRGAKFTCFIEKDQTTFKLLRDNLNRLDLSDKAEINNCDALGFINKSFLHGKRYDIIFIDPPYHTDMIEEVKKIIGKEKILNDNGMVIFEHFKKRVMEEELGRLRKEKDYRYGDTILSFYQESQEEKGL